MTTMHFFFNRTIHLIEKYWNKL